MRPDSHVSGDPENFPMARNRSGKKLKVNQCHYTRPTTTTGHLNTTYEFSAYFAVVTQLQWTSYFVKCVHCPEKILLRLSQQNHWKYGGMNGIILRWKLKHHFFSLVR
ncbi:unnamed protein product [Leptidea sinapis]|uniref:Uncharacterized protein n=1 Tax=Leptidea sinapis TaxID=189913 RepID=A0A5E4PX63_9NEOP|nr:unnamed protein product [Leptidea sinapis]